MPVKEAKLRELIGKVLKTHDVEQLTVNKIKRILEQDIGLEDKELDAQSAQVKTILAELLAEREEAPKSSESESTSKKRKQEDSDEEEKPKSKSKSKKQKADSEEENEDDTPKATKFKKNQEGNAYFLLPDDYTRVTVSKFRATATVDIRKYYIKDGSYAPTPKGISLTLDQFKILKENADAIDSAIEKLKK